MLQDAEIKSVNLLDQETKVLKIRKLIDYLSR